MEYCCEKFNNAVKSGKIKFEKYYEKWKMRGYGARSTATPGEPSYGLIHNEIIHCPFCGEKLKNILTIKEKKEIYNRRIEENKKYLRCFEQERNSIDRRIESYEKRIKEDEQKIKEIK